MKPSPNISKCQSTGKTQTLHLRARKSKINKPLYKYLYVVVLRLTAPPGWDLLAPQRSPSSTPHPWAQTQGLVLHISAIQHIICDMPSYCSGCCPRNHHSSSRMSAQHGEVNQRSGATCCPPAQNVHIHTYPRTSSDKLCSDHHMATFSLYPSPLLQFSQRWVFINLR